MSWWGKLIGGAMGFAMGGPIGMMLGMVLGANFDRGLAGSGAPRANERRQLVFYTAVFSVMGHLCKADGRVTRSEIRTARKIMREMGLDEDVQALAVQLFEQGKAPGFSLQATLAQFRKELGWQPNLYRMFLEIQVMAAYGDGKLHAAERRILLEICDLLGFPQEELDRLCDMADSFTGGPRRSTGPGNGLEQAYRTLGVDRKASDQDIKRAYRRLMSQHHPDKLIAKGLPEEMIKVATERTATIRGAYDLVRERRGSP